MWVWLNDKLASKSESFIFRLFKGVLCIKVGFTLFDIGWGFNNLVHFFFFVATILSIKVHFLMSG